jgi:dTDP-4-amino-4,6-dideoxygalactose transaminase
LDRPWLLARLHDDQWTTVVQPVDPILEATTLSANVPNAQSVPLLNLKAQYAQVGDRLEELVLGVLRSGNYILGEMVRSLEEQVAAICGAKYGVGVANGTDALILALWAADVGPGDEVITPSFTFAATAEAIALRGAKPIFVEIDPTNFNINADLIEAAITPKTKAIIPVHLYGQPAEMDTIMALAEKHNLIVIEDNAQAIGASYKGKPTGSLGHMACISFYPTKNLGAAGDAGMVVTSDAKLEERLRALRAHGMRVRYYHDEVGVNSRLDEIQAAVLLSKVPHLRDWTEKRNQIARWYQQGLKNVTGILAPEVTLRNTHVWHQYTIRVLPSAPISRDDLVRELSERGIGSMCYYPVPVHMQRAFAHFGYKKGDLPVSEKLAAEVVSLPMYPELTETQVKIVSTTIGEIINSRAAAGVQVVAGNPVAF